MSSSSRSSSTISRPENRPTTSAVRSSAVGPRPPLVMIRVIPVAAHELERGEQVVRPVADDLDHCGVDPDFPESLREPWPVAVGDDPSQDLGAGDEDPGAGGLAEEWMLMRSGAVAEVAAICCPRARA